MLVQGIDEEGYLWKDVGAGNVWCNGDEFE